MAAKNFKNPTRKLFLVQLGIIALMTGITWPLYGRYAALSIGSGGLVCFFPSWLFSLLLFKYRGALRAREIVLSLYLGEVIKLVVAIALFIVAFHILKLAPLAFLLGFIFVQSSIWLAPWLVK